MNITVKNFIRSIVLLNLICLSSTVSAANVINFWQKPLQPVIHKYLSQNTATQYRAAAVVPDNNYELRSIHKSNDKNGITHERFVEYYHGIPVYGYQVVTHTATSDNSVNKLKAAPLPTTGTLVTQIEKDISSLKPTLNPNDVMKIVRQQLHPSEKLINKSNRTNAKLIIYLNPSINNQSTALLAYHVSSYVLQQHRLKNINYIIDAQKGVVLKKWDNLHNNEIGEGPGGFTNTYSYHANQYYFGSSPNHSLNELGKIDITMNNNTCTMQDNFFRISSLKNVSVDNLDTDALMTKGAEVFSYPCSSSNEVNQNDNGYAPVNGAVSPINNVMFFARHFYDMVKNKYLIRNPLGNDLPIQIMVHVGEVENAFALATEVDDQQKITQHAQAWFGNGGDEFEALVSADVVGHELAHLYTAANSNLNYEEQSGGMNEAFSDISSVAFREYLHQQYSWYSPSWYIGLSISKTGEPMRYFDDPTKDGFSIGNAKDFVPGMDPHACSGVYNKAFYLMCVKYGIPIPQAYAAFLYANKHYWTPTTNYNEGACGVIQEAKDMHYSNDVINKITRSFAEVGVVCNV